MRTNNINLTRWEMLRRDYEAYSQDEFYKDSTPVHYHSDFYEVYFFESGNLVYHIEMEQYKLVPGDMLLIPPNTMHWPVIEDQSIPYRRMFVWIDQRYLRSLCSERTDLCACFDHKRYVIPLSPRLMADASMLVERLVTCGAQEDDAYGVDLHKRSLCTLLMLLINRACQRPDSIRKEAVAQSLPIRQATEYINNHLDDVELNLDSLSKRFLLSKSSLAKAFLGQMGISLHQYIIKRRMILAHRLLCDGMQPNKVYLQVGYTDYSAFYRAFQKEFGICPRDVSGEAEG